MVITGSGDQVLEAENTRQELGLICLLEAHGLTDLNRKNRQKPENGREDMVKNNPHRLQQESITLNDRKKQYYTKGEEVRWGSFMNKLSKSGQLPRK